MANKAECRRCGEEFLPRSSYLYCGKVVEQSCLTCGYKFGVLCSGRMTKYCGVPCSRGNPRESHPIKKCLECGEDFEVRANRAERCSRIREVRCHCGETFKVVCSRRPRQSCSGACEGSRKSQSRAEIPRKCRACDRWYSSGGPPRDHCGQPIMRTCEHCALNYETRCAVNGAACPAGPHRAVAHRNCQICGDEFIGDPTQRYCREWHQFPCDLCGVQHDNLNRNYLRKRPLVCSTLCGILRKAAVAKPSEEEMSTWRLLHKTYLRLGTGSAKEQVEEAAGVKFPRGGPCVFEARGVHEQIVAEIVGDTDHNAVRNKRPIKDTDTGGRLELDIWLPNLNLAFEIQDLLTHSRTSDTERSPYGLKRGPAYHERKRKLAMEQLGVTIVEIWEDEIIEGKCREMVTEAIAAAVGIEDTEVTP